MTDWTTDAADTIERTVATLRDRTVVPVQSFAKVVVYGLLAALIVGPAVLLALVGLFRLLVIIEQGYVWAAWFTLGGIFLIAGGFCWSKRNA